jgi:8-oxo-dGTP diphosphatase
VRKRPAARLLVIDPQDRLLLFRSVFSHGALAGTDFWATPGGAVDDGESFESAAKRELFEETGLDAGLLGKHVVEREFELKLPNGEIVWAQERFYVVRATTGSTIVGENQTEEERGFLLEHKWWHIDELRETGVVFYPEDLVEIVERVLSGRDE